VTRARLGAAARRGAALVLGLAALAWGAAWLVPLPARLGAAPSPALLDAEGEVLHVALAPDQRWRLPSALSRTDPRYLHALLVVEDARFRWHPGVDPAAVLRAAVGNLRAGAVTSGASTLTMQLVRMVEPRPRTLRSKAIEALRALQLELRFSKDELLELYLTFLPFGGNLEGVETACWALFGHSAAQLTDAEIALLLAIPQDPNGRRLGEGRRAALRAARQHIAGRLGAAGALQGAPDAVLADLAHAPLPTAARPLPRAVPHLAATRLRGAGAVRVPTTIHRGVQARVERVVANLQREAAENNVHNVAVVVMDHGDGAVRALVGGFDFAADTPAGQVPAFAVPRSPGSTLKPLLYAQAISAGLLLPEQLRVDVPARFGTYAPRNFDDRYDGLVRMEEALSRSLNVPFVNLLHDVGLEPFLGLLRRTGVRTLDPRPGRYGLSAIVGGLELSPLDVAAVFGALAREGRARPPRLDPAEDGALGEALVDPGAAYLTRRALRLRDRPDFPTRRALADLPDGLAWKTGTSFGHRDAWAVGVGPTAVVVVWLGNLDQRASRWLLGSEAAAPLLFDVLEAIGEGRAPPEPPPSDLGEVSVCAMSGHLPGPACPQQARALALAARVPPQRCPFHQHVEIDVETGEERLPTCRDGRPTRVEAVVEPPEELRRWLADQGRAAAPRPPLAPGCAAVGRSGPPQISAPPAGEVVLLLPGLPADRQELPLEASGGAAPLEWYVDGALVARADGDGRAWWAPRAGVHELLVVDARGRTDRRRVEVRAAPATADLRGEAGP
jgi:penicillin-binding protein 1C